MENRLLKSNDYDEIITEGYNYISQYYSSKANNDKARAEREGELNSTLNFLIDEFHQNRIRSQTLDLHHRLCDFNKSAHIIQDELNKISSVQNSTNLRIENRKYFLENLLNYKNDHSHLNILTHFYQGECYPMIWGNENSLRNKIEGIINDYEPEEFFDEYNDFNPRLVFDLNSLRLIEKLNIPLKKILIERGNEDILNNNWWVRYQIVAHVEDDFEKNRYNEDTFAYALLDIIGVRVDGNELIWDIEDENFCSGYEIHPLSENINELIKEKAIENFEARLLQNYLDGERYAAFFAENDYQIKIIKAEFEEESRLLK